MLKIKFAFFILFTIVGISFSVAQSNIKGIVRDAATDEALIGAVVSNQSAGKVMVTNNFGFFSLPVNNGTSIISISFMGYEPLMLTVQPNDTMIMIGLKQKNNQLTDVTVLAYRKQLRQLGLHTLSSKDFKNTPVLLAEKDVLKTIQLLPGVQQNAEGSSNFSVRGGSQDQNLILMDGIPVYNINHLFGFVSIFNTDATNKVTFYKGGIPARYGGRLSSVTDIVLREGNKNRYTGGISMGFLSSKFLFEGPLQKGKSSFLLTGRRSIYDLIISPITYLSDKQMSGYYLGDLTLKLNYKLNPNNVVFLSAYTGKDKVYTFRKEKQIDYTDKYNLGWSNITTAFRWNNTSINNIFSNFTLAYSSFKYLVFNESEKTTDGETKYWYTGYSSGITNLIARWDLSYYKIKNHQLNFGAEHIWHTFNPGISEKTSKISDTNDEEIKIGNTIIGSESSIYFEDILSYGNLKANIGIRQSWFSTSNKTYSGFQPRISAEYSVNDDIKISVGYDRIYQYLHMVSNNNIGMPTDLWLPITNNNPPQSSKQYSVGAKYQINDQLSVSAETYYKEMSDLTDYRDGIVVSNEKNNWDEILVQGKGKSYGIEFMVEKNGERLSGWVNYTLSKSEREFSDINFGTLFPFMYDRRNVINIIANYKLSQNKSICLSWVGSNGYWMNLNYDNYFINNQFIRNFKNRNNYQVPAFHHLDASYTISKPKKRGTRNWVFGVYNLYARNNYYSVRQTYDYGDVTQPKLIGTGLFPIIPYVSWEFVFK